jgi:hypothetical protein
VSELVTGHTTPAATAPAKREVPIRSLPAPLRRFGLFSAMAMAITYTVFLLGFFANSASLVPRPWDQIIAVGASLLIAPSFVLMVVAVHHAAPDAKKMWTQAAMAFAVLYAAFVSTVYVTLLFVVEPHVMDNTRSAVAPFLFDKGTFLQMLDGLGYTYMSLAVFMTAPVYIGGGISTWLRWLAIVSGPSAIGVLASYYFYSFPLELLGIGSFLVPAYGWLLMAYFHRARGDSS